MKKRTKLKIFILISLALAMAAPAQAFGQPAPLIHAQTHVLIEAQTGRILSENEAHRRMFPAATTMILTAILAYEHIGMDDIIVAGSEVNMLPPASARNGHEVGEAISGQNLLRGMLIGAGNDTSNIVAIEVIRRLEGDWDIDFAAAQQLFANLMNQRAQELGALDSHFMNPHGFHHDSHFTTAYDMAQIARHALGIDVIMQIVGAGSFSGPMAGYATVPEGALQLSRNWNSANELIQPGPNFYPYAIGLRTGFTNQAGYSLVAAARREGVSLISVTFNSPVVGGQPTRWQDNISLFEYGFANYAYRVFFESHSPVGSMDIYNPALDDYGHLEFFATQGGSLFLSEQEMGRLVRDVDILPEFLLDVYDDDTGEYTRMFVAPIEEGQVLGTISYELDGEIIFSTALYAARGVTERTTVRDIEYFMNRLRQIFFTSDAIPFWIAGVSVLILLAVLIILARNSIRRKRRNNRYKLRRF